MDYIIEILNSLVRDGVFGPGKLISAEPGPECDITEHSVSAVNFLKVSVSDGSSTVIHPVLVKTQSNDEKMRDVMITDMAFKNEVIFYKELLPKLGSKLFPRFYYGFFTGGKEVSKDIIVLEDLHAQGYVSSIEKVFLDPDHIILALQHLGEFHALSHLAKRKTSTFLESCLILSESKYEIEQFHHENCPLFMERGIIPFINDDYKDLLDKVLEKTKDVASLVRAISEPIEPFSVLCHGDFYRGNLLFKYNKKGKPIGVKFVDMKSCRYTSPAYDLSFLLYMNTTKRTRAIYWDIFLEAYWESFVKVLPDPGFHFEQFKQHFAQRAFFGYIPCSFLLPTMMNPELRGLEELLSLTKEQRQQYDLQMGGEIATRALTDIIQHLHEKRYLQKLLTIKV